MAKDILYPLRRLHGIIHAAKEKLKLRSAYKAEFKKNPKTVFLILTPEHGNLGDHAIASAEINFLNKLGIKYIEITGAKLDQMKWSNHLGVMNGYPILLQGGGYLGTLWFSSEECLREVIRKNPKSDIFMFPNTIYYEDNEWGQEEFGRSTQIYNWHKKLHLYAREKTSYEVMRKAYRDVQLVPDMVLSLKKDTSTTARKGCLLCLRGDCEKTRTPEQEQIIRSQAQLLFGDDVGNTDMVVKGHVLPSDRETALEKKYQEFRSAELVITDRLHGMIFCAITGAPCIVLDSKSPKVRGCYEWIKHLDYIRFADKPEDISALYGTIPKENHFYDNSHLEKYYQSLAEDIQTIWR